MSLVLHELVQRPDGTIGLGNSIEVESEAEAIALVQDGKAIFEGHAIGVIPVGMGSKVIKGKNGVEDAE